ncbi:MAG: type III-B CRISPR module-associated Cmr3 family protein [Fimbriimonadales bacterium]|nr:MAG: CRISPR-associated RAMP protein Csx10 [Fimbriimonadales bacterium]
MKRIAVQLEAQSPIAVGEWMSSRSNVRESMRYIPGGVLRGALAQAVLEQLGMHRSSRRMLGAGDPALQQAFETCFGKDGAQFGFLMPFANQDWIPAPATALFNKQRDEYLYDTLFALLRDEKYEMECPRTGARLERGRGWLVPKNGEWRKATTPAPRAFVRVGLNRKLEAAQEGVLYTLEAIDPTDAQGAPVAFRGAVVFPDDACERAFNTILEALRWRDGAVRLRIGSARTRGFGEVVLKLADESLPETPADLDAFEKRAGAPVFTLLARTPVLVHDASGAPAHTLSPELLREYLPGLPDSVRLLPEATRIERVQVSGWSGAWGMPKPVQQAFAPGSVFTYTYAQDDRDALQAWLQQLNTHSIGERTAEGYGQLVACSRYHLDNDITQYSGGAQ